MILVSEIGDKTFLVAALMAMRHPRLVVFSAAFSALIMMTVLSAVLGHAVPTLIPKTFTKFMAAVLFLIFGVKMLKEGREMSPDEGVGEEMREVEAELESGSSSRSEYNPVCARKLPPSPSLATCSPSFLNLLPVMHRVAFRNTARAAVLAAAPRVR